MSCLDGASNRARLPSLQVHMLCCAVGGVPRDAIISRFRRSVLRFLQPYTLFMFPSPGSKQELVPLTLLDCYVQPTAWLHSQEIEAMKKTVVLYPGLSVSHFVPMVQLADVLLAEGYAVVVAYIDPTVKGGMGLPAVVDRLAASSRPWPSTGPLASRTPPPSPIAPISSPATAISWEGSMSTSATSSCPCRPAASTPWSWT